jgi:hypothetical protein
MDLNLIFEVFRDGGITTVVVGAVVYAAIRLVPKTENFISSVESKNAVLTEKQIEHFKDQKVFFEKVEKSIEKVTEGLIQLPKMDDKLDSVLHSVKEMRDEHKQIKTILDGIKN